MTANGSCNHLSMLETCVSFRAEILCLGRSGPRPVSFSIERAVSDLSSGLSLPINWGTGQLVIPRSLPR